MAIAKLRKKVKKVSELNETEGLLLFDFILKSSLSKRNVKLTISSDSEVQPEWLCMKINGVQKDFEVIDNNIVFKCKKLFVCDAESWNIAKHCTLFCTSF